MMCAVMMSTTSIQKKELTSAGDCTVVHTASCAGARLSRENIDDMPLSRIDCVKSTWTEATGGEANAETQ
jgi:hypothetical protein